MGWAQHLADDADCVASLQQARETYQKNECETPEVLAHIEELLALHGDSGSAAAQGADDAATAGAASS